MWNNKSNKAFTLIELMAVVLIVSIGMIGTMNLISTIFIHARLTSSKLLAAYLAQEGIEIVRNIRDTNWLEGEVAWDDGISLGDFEADYDDQELSLYGERFLRIDGGFYNYSSGEETKFKRKITIQKDTDEISITVTVSWDDHEIQTFEKLYDWK